LDIFFANRYSISVINNKSATMSNNLTTPVPAISASNDTQVTSSIKDASRAASHPNAPKTHVIESHVLAITDDKITISIPSQKPLTLERSPSLPTQDLVVGQKIQLVLTSDKQMLHIAISKESTSLPIEQSVPLNKELSALLAKHTTLPMDLERQVAFITKHQPLSVGVARKLPNQQIKLVTNAQDTLKARLPTPSTIPLNQSFNLALAVNDKGVPIVIFRQTVSLIAIGAATIELSQLKQLSPKLNLHTLPINTVTDVTQLLKTQPLAPNPIPKIVDMEHPHIKLWLRHQPIKQIISTLAQTTREFIAMPTNVVPQHLNSASEKHVLNNAINTASYETATTIDKAVLNELKTSATIDKNVSTELKKPVTTDKAVPNELKTTATTDKPLSNELKKPVTADKAVPNELKTLATIEKTVPNELKTPATIEKTVPNELKTAATIERTVSNELKTAATIERTVSNELKTPTTIDKTVPNELKTAATIERTVSNELKTPTTIDKPLSNELKTAANIYKAVSNELKTAATIDKPLSNELKTPATIDKAVSTELKTPANIDKNVPNELKTPANIDKAVPNEIKTPATIDKAVSNEIKTPATIDKAVSHELKTLASTEKSFPNVLKSTTSELLANKLPQHQSPPLGRSPGNLVQNATPSQPANPSIANSPEDTSPELMPKRPPSTSGANDTLNTPPNQSETKTAQLSKPSLSLQKLSSLLATLQQHHSMVPAKELSTTSTTDSDELSRLEAIEQFKQLVHTVPQQLPSMSQLVNPAQLAHTIAQFSTFVPLAASSINLSSLGPLAGALQLILGARGAGSSVGLSPAMQQQMSKLINKKAKPNPALLQALQLLGTLSNLKPLEDALTSLSSHITLYQYQNLESNLNNHQLFYFTLPTREQGVDQIEGEIEHQQETSDGEKSWRLTLLLPIGDGQKLKAIAVLASQNVTLEFVCSDAVLLDIANSYQQFLADRLLSLGFNQAEINCRHAPIEKSLLKRPNQLVELVV